MVMEHNNCLQCLADLEQAISLGFTHHFRLSQTGLIHHTRTQKVYDIDQIKATVKTCMACSTSSYLITTIDGIKGIAVEFWEVWSEK